MDNRGFIKIHRKLLKWEWYQDINTKVLFLHLLLSSNWEDRRWQGVMVMRGQLISGRKKLAKETGLTERQIRTSLDKLKQTDEVTIKTTNKYTLYTIVNYSSYQDTEERSDQQNVQRTTSKRPARIIGFHEKAKNSDQQTTSDLTSKKPMQHLENISGYDNRSYLSDQQSASIMAIKRPTSDQQATTIKEVKEVKEVKKYPPIVPQGMEEGEVCDYLSMSFSESYQAVLNCWKEERDNAGLSTGLIGKNSKVGAMKLAEAIDKGEVTLIDARKAIQNLLADSEKRDSYSLTGLVNNFELWVSRSSPETDNTIQLNQTRITEFYFGTCSSCNYSLTGFDQGATICPRCESRIELRKEV